ncbi:MAG: WecB/TagA/CpsF family glycosyltransferase [Rubrobacter sp.]|nr:WecB/TagA/CpsF family glycosyltransferase [Rubrobacter sp.]
MAEARVNILGVGVDALTAVELHERIRRFIHEGGHALVFNANVHCLNLAYRDRSLRRVLDEADVVFCDGAGVMLAARMLGGRMPERITYADWIYRLSDLAESEGFSMYFLGGKPGVAGKAAEELRSSRPALDISGTHHGHFEKSGPESEAVIEEINAASPDLLLVGMGMPVQEKWLMENRDRLGFRVALSGGAVFDYASGELRRGPRLLTDNGLEWLARLAIEPGRLWRRYLIGNPLFMARVIRQAARRKLRGR